MALSTTGIRFDGLSSGIDYQSIIDKLLSLDKKPISALQVRIKTATDQKTAYQDLAARLLVLQGTASLLSKTYTFNRTSVSSSNENVLFGSGDFVGATGSYSFAVRRVAQSHQVASQGFADSDTTPVGAGTLTIELGNGAVDRRTPIEFLRGQAGIDRGKFRITDQSGGSAIVDLSSAVDVQDVLDSINNVSGISVEAFTDGDRLALRDTSGGAGTLSVQNYGTDTTATDLGLVGTLSAASGTVLRGQGLNYVTGTTSLAVLNDGNGVRQKGTVSSDQNDFSITLRDGTVLNVNIPAGATTVQGVLDAVNTALGANGSLALNSDRNGFVLRDFTAGAGVTTLTPLSNSNALVDLGLVGVTAENSATGLQDAANGDTIVGRRVLASLNTILRRTLNGGTNDFHSDGTPAADLAGVRDGSVTLQDRTGASTTLDLSARFNTTAAAPAAPGQNQIDVGSVSGFAIGGRIRVTDGATTEYHTITGIDTGLNRLTLSENISAPGGFAAGAAVYGERETLGSLLDTLNQGAAAAGVQIAASVGAAGNALLVSDQSGASTANLQITDAAGFAATDLGIAQSVAAPTIRGADLDPRYITENTKLATLNAGKGVFAGKFRITDTDGVSFNVDLSQTGDDTIDRAILDINGASAAVGSGIVARVNDTGDGLLLTDTAPGTGLITVTELDGGSTAKDLGLLGSSTVAGPTVLNGSFERTITIGAEDSLSDVSSALNTAGIGVTASIINDGSALNPHRLTILSRTTGSVGRLVIGGSSPLAFQTTAEAQDAVLVYGSGAGSGSPILVRSSKNTIQGVVPGLTLDLRSASASPVTVNVSRDLEGILDQADRLASNYNDVLSKIKDLTKFDPKTLEKGALFGESAVNGIRRELSRLMTTPIEGLASQNLNTLGEVGYKLESDGRLTLDKSKLDGLLATKFDEVVTLFTRERPIVGSTALADLRDGGGINSSSTGTDLKITRRDGVIFEVETSSLTSVDQLLIAINSNPGNTGGLLQASIGADGKHFELKDLTGGAGTLSASSINGSSTATDLGFTAPVSDTVLKGVALSLKNDPGAASRLSDRLKGFTDAPDGVIETRTDGLDKNIEAYNKKITRIGESIERHEERLVREFARLESFLSQSQGLQTALAGQLNNIIQGFQNGLKK
ncbi:MAG: flagellar filament capping protein FliD [Planctomycetes bacterium]|nr:flagellar filament capping protein FliD [Planctomycetota bacterium]